MISLFAQGLPPPIPVEGRFMVPDPFPGHGQDGEEPEGSSPLPAGGNGPDAPAPADAGEDEMPPEGAEQGLFVCLPPEELTLAGFAQDGRADTMAPGPLLATVVHAITGDDGAGAAPCRSGR